MCQFDTPNFIYYSYIIVFILTFITALSVLLKNTTHPANRDAFIFMLMMAFWILNDFAQWIFHSIAINLFFARISILFFFIFLFFLYFSYEFARKPITFAKKLFLAIPFLALTPFVLTDFNVEIYSASTCDFAIGPLIFYGYFLTAAYATLATKILVKKFQDLATPLQVRAQIKILISAIWFAWIWIVIFDEVFRISTLKGAIIDISPYFIVGELFFVSLIAFAIIKCDLFNFNTVPATAFSLILWSAIFISILFFPVNIFFTLVSAILYVILLLVFWKV
jgi:hypothetical protein